MSKAGLFIGICTVLVLTGCDSLAVHSGNTGAGGAAVSSALPSNVAGPRVTINLPRRMQPPLVMNAFGVGDTVHIAATSVWHGRRVRVYYVPPENTRFDRGHYDLHSTVNLQQIAEVSVAANGTWRATWKHGKSIRLSNPLFLMAQSDIGEIGLVQVHLGQKI